MNGKHPRKPVCSSLGLKKNKNMMSAQGCCIPQVMTGPPGRPGPRGPAGATGPASDVPGAAGATGATGPAPFPPGSLTVDASGATASGVQLLWDTEAALPSATGPQPAWVAYGQDPLRVLVGGRKPGLAFMGQETGAVGVGFNIAVYGVQHAGGVAVGPEAGLRLQGQDAVALGRSGTYDSGELSTCVGTNAGRYIPPAQTVCVGAASLLYQDGGATGSVSMGAYSAPYGASGPCVLAGYASYSIDRGPIPSGAIICNASGSTLRTTPLPDTWTIGPVQVVRALGLNHRPLFYDPTSHEVVVSGALP